MQIGAGTVFAGLIPRPAAMPALLSTVVAAQVDDTFTVTLGGQQIELHQIAEATQFPSAIPNSPFIVVPIRALLERELAVPEPGITLDQVWAMGSANPLPALREHGFIPGRTVQRSAPIEATLAQLPQSLAVGMNFTAAAGGVGLVIIGVSASLYFAQRRRDYEFAALRAMGAERSQIRRTLMLEQGLLLGFAMITRPTPPAAAVKFMPTARLCGSCASVASIALAGSGQLALEQRADRHDDERRVRDGARELRGLGDLVELDLFLVRRASP